MKRPAHCVLWTSPRRYLSWYLDAADVSQETAIQYLREAQRKPESPRAEAYLQSAILTLRKRPPNR